MNAPLHPHIKKLLTEDQQKLFKQQITQLCSPSVVLGYERYIEKPLEKFISAIFSALIITLIAIQFGFISKQTYYDFRWLLGIFIIIAISIVAVSLMIWFVKKYKASPYSLEIEKSEHYPE